MRGRRARLLAVLATHLLMTMRRTVSCGAYWKGSEVTIDCDESSLEAAVSAARPAVLPRAHNPLSVVLAYCPPPAPGADGGVFTYAQVLTSLGARHVMYLELRAPERRGELRDVMLAGLAARLSISCVTAHYTITLAYEPGPASFSEGASVTVRCKQADAGGRALARCGGALAGRQVRARMLSLNMCLVEPFAQLLTGVGVSVGAVRELHVSGVLAEQLAESHLSGLALTHLRIDNVAWDTAVELGESLMSDGAFSLSQLGGAGAGLRALELRGVTLAPLPRDNVLEQVTLVEGKALWVFGGCSRLRELQLIRWRLPALERGEYLSQCGELRALLLRQLAAGAVRAVLGAARGAARPLLELAARSCQLGMLDDAFDAWLSPSLRTLDLADNLITDVTQLVSAVGTLDRLILDDNPLHTYCERWSEARPPVSARELSLRAVGLARLCFADHNDTTTLHLENNNITDIDWVQLPRGLGAVTVDLRGNPVRLAAERGERACLAQLAEKRNTTRPLLSNVTVVMNVSLNCDCEYSCAAEQLRAMAPTVSVRGVWCGRGAGRAPLQALSAARLRCARWRCGACECRRGFARDAVAADCRARGLRRLPAQLAGLPLEALLADDNRIETIALEDLPDTLRLVELRNNTVLSLSAAAAARLFAVRRDIALGGTRVPCRCDALPWLQALQQHGADMIRDYDELLCEGEAGVPVRLQSLAALCERGARLGAPAAGGGAAAALVAGAAAALLYRRYQLRVKVFLFSRGWCLACVAEQDAEPGRDYDAFISFCYQDDEFVMENLVPELSEYSLCIHYRDWAPGGWIPEQIASSVQRSQRTIIVLTQQFLDSQWSLVEFRMAHAMTLQEKRTRIIILVVGDVLSDARIDAELGSYLATNTYLKWGDPWFFEKLKYALPNKTGERRDDSTIPMHVTLNNLRVAMDTYHRDDSTGPAASGPRLDTENNKSQIFVNE